MRGETYFECHLIQPTEHRVYGGINLHVHHAVPENEDIRG